MKNKTEKRCGSAAEIPIDDSLQVRGEKAQQSIPEAHPYKARFEFPEAQFSGTEQLFVEEQIYFRCQLDVIAFDIKLEIKD